MLPGFDLATYTATDLAALDTALREEKTRRAEIAAYQSGIDSNLDELEAIGRALPVITRTSTTPTPEYGWLPGQAIKQGGRLWRNTSRQIVFTPPGTQITAWAEEVEPEPEAA